MNVLSNRQKIRLVILFVMLLLFPVLLNYMSPYLIIMGASEGIINGSALLFLGLFISSLFLGRGWCGWFCPASCVGEVCSVIQKKPVGEKIRLIKWGIWFIWMGIIIAMIISAGGYHKVSPFYMTEKVVSLTDPFNYITYYFVLATILVLSLSLGKRGFCHSVCWMAPFMIIGSKLSNLIRFPKLRLKASPQNCVSCETCSKNCPMSLDVHKMVVNQKMENMDCILCGQCVDSCKKGAIRYIFARPA
jgi:polyferredoxin